MRTESPNDDNIHIPVIDIKTRVGQGINQILAMDLSSREAANKALKASVDLRELLEYWRMDAEEVCDDLSGRLDSVQNMLGEAGDALPADDDDKGKQQKTA